MSLFVDEHSCCLIQGLGAQGERMIRLSRYYGFIPVAAAVHPGRGGEMVHDVPVYDTVVEAIARHKVDATGIFTGAPYVRDATWEALDAGIQLLLINAEGVSVHDAMALRAYGLKRGAWIIGPNSPGIVIPGRCNFGHNPQAAFMPGPVGIVSRSGTLMVEVADVLSRHGIGQTAALAVGGDMVLGRSQVEYVRLLNEDPETAAIVLVCELGGNQEDESARYWAEEARKPMFALVVGRWAQQGKRMGHAGAIAYGNTATAEGKRRLLAGAGVRVVDTIWELPDLIRRIL